MPLDDVLNTKGHFLNKKVELVFQLVGGDIFPLGLTDIVSGPEEKSPPPDRGIRVSRVDDDRDMTVALLDLLQKFQPSEDPLPAESRSKPKVTSLSLNISLISISSSTRSTTSLGLSSLNFWLTRLMA